MTPRPIYLFSILGVAILAITTYRFAVADDAYNPAPVDIRSFATMPCLVVYDLGTVGVDQTVLVDASITDIGGKRFLGGTVTDKYPDISVDYPGKPAYISLDRIAYIQILDVPEIENGE